MALEYQEEFNEADNCRKEKEAKLNSSLALVASKIEDLRASEMAVAAILQAEADLLAGPPQDVRRAYELAREAETTLKETMKDLERLHGLHTTASEDLQDVQMNLDRAIAIEKDAAENLASYRLKHKRASAHNHSFVGLRAKAKRLAHENSISTTGALATQVLFSKSLSQRPKELMPKKPQMPNPRRKRLQNPRRNRWSKWISL